MLFIGVCFLGFLAHILAEENLHINMDLTGVQQFPPVMTIFP